MGARQNIPDHQRLLALADRACSALTLPLYRAGVETEAYAALYRILVPLEPEHRCDARPCHRRTRRRAAPLARTRVVYPWSPALVFPAPSTVESAYGVAAYGLPLVAVEPRREKVRPIRAGGEPTHLCADHRPPMPHRRRSPRDRHRKTGVRSGRSRPYLPNSRTTKKYALKWIYQGVFEWSQLVSNQRPSACEADALPLSYGTEAIRSAASSSPSERDGTLTCTTHPPPNHPHVIHFGDTRSSAGSVGHWASHRLYPQSTPRRPPNT